MINHFKKAVRAVRSGRTRSLWRAGVNFLFMYVKVPWAPALPVYITLEPASVCNLSCPVCETGNGTLNRKQTLMKIETFQRIVDKIHSHTNTLMMYFMGESLLHPKIYEMIEYARRRRIYVIMCTNGEVVDPERLVKSGIDEISFQIGGVTQDVHKVYRVGGNINNIMENLKQPMAVKKRLGVSKPSIELGYVVMKHNECEVEGFYQLAERLGVDKVNMILPRVRNVEQGKQFLPEKKKYWLYDWEDFSKGTLSSLKGNQRGCDLLWYTTIITWNGDVVPCCRDPRGEHVMGNILREDLKDIWNNKKYRELRKTVIRQKRKDRDVEMCRTCVE